MQMREAHSSKLAH